jgi:two-component system, chemotaxis family, response regulator Rcp1
MRIKSPRTFEILLVEDNPGDVRFVQEALKEEKLYLYRLHVAMDGLEALDFLYRRGKHFQAPSPDLIFLDLNLPKKDGLEVLEIIKKDIHLRLIPTLVMTSSSLEKDILRSYRLHANSYIIKPTDIDDFIAILKQIEMFWFTVATLPRSEKND